MAHRGWHQIAYEREVLNELTSVSIESTELMLVKQSSGLRAYDIHCPHRGANLCRGGKLRDDHVVCPFHGRRIGLDAPGEDGFAVSGYRTIVAGGLVFVLFDETCSAGFDEYLRRLDETHFIVPGFTVTVPTRPEYVIENALDRRHFAEVHGVINTPELQLLESEAGEMAVRAQLLTPRPNSWQAQASAGVELLIRIFSPTVCATELTDGTVTRTVLTAATPDGTGQCRIRVSVAAPPRADGSPPEEGAIRALLRDSRTAIEQDARIWEHLPRHPRNCFAADDGLVVQYYRFCSRFRQTRSPQDGAGA
jgi:phenylpropionate dioxygenase-like ring-hydroxylating dioxygenase large terminal subunit